MKISNKKNVFFRVKKNEKISLSLQSIYKKMKKNEKMKKKVFKKMYKKKLVGETV